MNELSGELRRILDDLDVLWNDIQESGLPEDSLDEICREIEEACEAVDRALHFFPSL